LLGHGLSNRQMAAGLGLSEGNARLHVGNILIKLDAPNRTATGVEPPAGGQTVGG
jgi:two-component system, NarL family, nitrate/nitrite response regulator NarL